MEPLATDCLPPSVFLTKNECSLFFCSYYWKLNGVNVQESGSILLSEADFRQIKRGDSALFHTPPATSGYCQTDFGELCCDKKVFTSSHVPYICTRVYLGMQKSTMNIRRKICILFDSVRWPLALVYVHYELSFSISVIGQI